MGKHWSNDALDAYGHLAWTVGNEDWIACFDAIRVGNVVRYHVVVDCESGGFTDTMEEGSKPLDEAVDFLKGLPDYWAGVCEEHYWGEDGEEYQVISDQTLKCAEAWLAHLQSLVSAPPSSEDEGGEEEPFDPVRDGWVGRDGRP